MPIDPLDETMAESIRPGKLVSGAPIGGYQLLEVLGEGGMGIVWSAHDPNLDRQLAIKVLKRTDASPELRKRLLREARAMARLKHPNVLTVYEVGTEGERDYIAMELVEGGTLAAWLEHKPPREAVIAAIVAAGRGLAAAHGAGLVHRDFKPHNVLRSTSGRVVVTDFGLARGLDEAGVAEATPSPASSGDNLLHTPLTRTGALVGTPAYMAPEQYTGRPPDPRTDQFSFCVTAWQALTGTRPYDGDSLEALFKAIHAGVDKTAKDLPPRVRDVLARGLDPDPDRRWPDLESLLDAFVAAFGPRARWPWIAGGLAVAAIAVALIVVGTSTAAKKPDAQPSIACEPADTTLAPVWSAVRRGAFVGKATDDRLGARIADGFDRFAAGWTVAYDDACKLHGAKQAGRLGCLTAALDRFGEVVAALDGASRTRLAAFDPFALVPNVAACVESIAPGKPPDDAAGKAAIVAVIRAIIDLRDVPIDRLDAAAAALDAAARATGWAPLYLQAAIAIGDANLRAGRIGKARETWKRVRTIDGRSPRTIAEVDLGLLAASIVELAEPGSDDLDLKAPPKTAPPLHAELRAELEQAKRSVKAAGGDPELAGKLAMLDAQLSRGLGQWSRYAKPYRDAIDRAAEARRAFDQDLERAGEAAAIEARLDLEIGNLDDAVFVARTAADALERAGLAAPPALDAMRDELAHLRGDYTELHARMDRRGTVAPMTAALHTGIVVDGDGKPAAGARVVAWTGELHGNPLRAFTDPRALVGEVATTAADGSFAIHAPPGAAIVAERGDLRAAPRAIAGSPRLALEPTTVAIGMADGANLLGVDAVARYAVGTATWFVHAPIAKDRSYHVAGLPRGYVLGAIGPACDATRRVVARGSAITWPSGQNLEVITPATAPVSAWIFPGGTPAPHLRVEAEALAATTSGASAAHLRPIGADATDAGRAHYARGDLHAVSCGHPDGAYLVCVAADEAVSCVTATIKGGPVIDLGDHRIGTGVAPVPIELP